MDLAAIHQKFARRLTGPDEHHRTFRTECTGGQHVSITFTELGLPDTAQYEVTVVWDGRASHAATGGLSLSHRPHGRRAGAGAGAGAGVGRALSAELGPWESVMYKLIKTT